MDEMYSSYVPYDVLSESGIILSSEHNTGAWDCRKCGRTNRGAGS